MTRHSLLENRSLKKRVTVSVMAQLLGQLFAGGLGVAVLKIMTNSLGPATYGLYATSLAFVTTFSLLTELGLNTITTREIAKAPENASEILSQNMGLRLFLAVVMIPVISGLSFLIYPNAVHTLRLGILLFSTYLIFDAIWATSVTYFTAKVRSDIPAIITAAQQTLFFLSVIGVAFLGWGLFGFIASYVATISLGSVAALYLTRKHLHGIRPSVNLRLWKKAFTMSIALGTMSVINMVYAKADSILISLFKGTTAVGVYGIAYSLINVCMYLASYVMGALTPTIATSKKDELEQIVQKTFHFMVTFACLLTVAGFVVRKDIVLAVSNEHFASASAPFAILAFATAFSYLSNVFTYACVAINKHHRIMYVSIASLVLNVGTNLVLIPRFGLIGAAWATVLSEFFVLVFVYRTFHQATGISIRSRIAIKPAAAAIIALVVGVMLNRMYVVSNTLYETAVLGATVCIAYFITLYMLHGLPSEIKSVIDKVFSALFRFLRPILSLRS